MLTCQGAVFAFASDRRYETPWKQCPFKKKSGDKQSPRMACQKAVLVGVAPLPVLARSTMQAAALHAGHGGEGCLLAICTKA